MFAGVVAAHEDRNKNKESNNQTVQTTAAKEQVKDYIMHHTKKGQTVWLSDIVVKIQDETNIDADLLTIRDAAFELIKEGKLKVAENKND